MKWIFILGIIATAIDSTVIKFLRKLKFEILGNLMKMEWYLRRGGDGIRVVGRDEVAVEASAAHIISFVESASKTSFTTLFT